MCGELDRLRSRGRVSVGRHFNANQCSEITTLLPAIYNLLPLTAASSALVEILSESVFRYGKGTKILTEPLVAWCIGPNGQQLVGAGDFGPLWLPV
jgi:hypothetical protein